MNSRIFRISRGISAALIVSLFISIFLTNCDKNNGGTTPVLNGVASCEGCHTDYAHLQKVYSPDTAAPVGGCGEKHLIMNPTTGFTWEEMDSKLIKLQVTTVLVALDAIMEPTVPIIKFLPTQVIFLHIHQQCTLKNAEHATEQ